MKKLLTGEKKRTKKNTTEKMITPMPMGRKQKKWMSTEVSRILLLEDDEALGRGICMALETPDEIRLLDNRKAILFIRGERPIMDDKYDLKKHVNFRYTEDGGASPYDYAKTPLAHDDLKIDIKKSYQRNPSSIAAYSTSIHISCLAFFELMKYNERNCRRYEHGLHDTQRGKRKMGRFVPSSQLLLRRGAYSRRCENGRCLAAS